MNSKDNVKKYLETTSVLSKTVITITAIGALARSPLRALSLGLRSLIRRPQVKSLRSNEIETIRTKVHCNLNQGNDQFLVVRGPMGIGKSLVIRNALSHTWGAFFTSYSITPGMKKGEIMDKVLHDFAFSTGFPYPCIYKIRVAERLIWWNNFLTSLSGHRRKPIVVIRVDERYKGKPHAELAEAAHNLARMGLRVVIDSQDDAISDHFYSSQIRIDIEPMSTELIEKIPEIQDFIEFLKKNNMYQETLAVLGGDLIAWSTLRLECFIDINRSKTAVIERYLNIIMNEASHHRYSAIYKNEKMEKLLDRFVGQPATYGLEESEVRNYIGLCEIGDNLKYVLRRSSDNIYKPASAEMSLLLRAGINKNAKITFDLIKESVEKINKSN